MERLREKGEGGEGREREKREGGEREITLLFNTTSDIERRCNYQKEERQRGWRDRKKERERWMTEITI